MDEANESLNKKPKPEIEGRIEIGEIIVPQSYDKVVISSGQVSTKKVETEGRKIPIESIRKKFLKEQKIYMNLRENYEYELLQGDHVVDSLKILMNLQKKTLFYQQKFWYKNLNKLKGKDT